MSSKFKSTISLNNYWTILYDNWQVLLIFSIFIYFYFFIFILFSLVQWVLIILKDQMLSDVFIEDNFIAPNLVLTFSYLCSISQCLVFIQNTTLEKINIINYSLNVNHFTPDPTLLFWLKQEQLHIFLLRQELK